MRNKRSPGFSVFFFAGVIAFIWLFPFEDISEVREKDPEITTTMSSEEVTINEGRLINDTPMVPFEETFQELEADITWNEDSEIYTADREGDLLQFEVNDTEVNINGEFYPLEEAVERIEDTVYVPLNLIATAYGSEITWDLEENSAVIEEGRKEITVFMQPEEEKQEAEEVPEEEELRELSGKVQVDGIAIGDSQGELEDTWGEAERITMSHYGFSWHAYHDEYENYRMAGIENEEVVALYTNNEWKMEDSSLSALDRDEIRNTLGEPEQHITKGNTQYTQNQSDEFDLFQLEEGYLTVFYDIHEEHSVTAAELIETDTEHNLMGFYGPGSEDLAADAEMQMFDLVNADRVKHDLEPLAWNGEVAEVAKAHSEDMAERNYFSHESPEGLSPFDRMNEAGLTYSRAGENLASGQASAVFAEQGLMNSLGHRENILNPSYDELGIGVVFSEGDRPFYTQKYYTP
ncbi:CAP-associated domain-containing protein [Alkalicoccus daliensis]|uniref:Copper amine oxidase N-terminal domain-containing protein n=1 Tax=Alkalicoccus daliensis TaxID=745820 RepID=A0A1H0J289_9BACI|nr:CAP-associated domain-containing protein [Alkalicoccus daliensis]SDO37826.1 Copper amine oxidase N-terminal domain-containing protein [Alkalicoccus daliensis]